TGRGLGVDLRRRQREDLRQRRVEAKVAVLEGLPLKTRIPPFVLYSIGVGGAIVVVEQITDDETFVGSREVAEKGCALPAIDADLEEVAGRVRFPLNMIDRYEQPEVDFGEPARHLR